MLEQILRRSIPFNCCARSQNEAHAIANRAARQAMQDYGWGSAKIELRPIASAVDEETGIRTVAGIDDGRGRFLGIYTGEIAEGSKKSPLWFRFWRGLRTLSREMQTRRRIRRIHREILAKAAAPQSR